MKSGIPASLQFDNIACFLMNIKELKSKQQLLPLVVRGTLTNGTSKLTSIFQTQVEKCYQER